MICPCGYAHNNDEAEFCKQCGEPLDPLRLKLAKGTRDYDRVKAQADARKGIGAAVKDATPENRHVLVSFGAQPVVMTQGKSYILGRLDEADITIPSQRVSRKHTEIFWRSNFPVARNLSSSSSTLVNGKAIDEHELRSRDKIEVGPYECQYVLVKPGAPIPEFDEALEGGGAGAGDADLTMEDAVDVALNGRLEQMGLWGLLRTFELQKKTGTLSLHHESKEGRIVVDRGRFESAGVGDATGKQALFELLTWSEGAFDFSTEKKAAPRKLIRKFDYSDAGPSRDELKNKRISRILEEAEDSGIEEPVPTAPPPKPAPRPAPAARRPPPPGRRPPPGARRPPPPGRRPPPPARRPPPPGRRPAPPPGRPAQGQRPPPPGGRRPPPGGRPPPPR